METIRGSKKCFHDGGGGVQGTKGYYIKFTWDWGVQGIFSILLQCKYKFPGERGGPHPLLDPRMDSKGNLNKRYDTMIDVI